MTAAFPQLTRRIEAERVRLENLAIGQAARTGNTALRHAIAAVRIGTDPVAAVRDVLWGNPAIGLVGLEDLFTRSLVTAYLLGLRRTVLSARQRFGAGNVELSRTGNQIDAWMRKLAGAAAIAETEVAGLFQRARFVARGIIQRITPGLFKRVGDAARDVREAAAAVDVTPADSAALPRYAPSGMRGAAAELGRQFAKAGFVPGAEHGIGPELSAGMVRSYESGRARGWRMTPVRERLWGFHYSAVLDSKTTLLCRGLEGTTLPADDPFWAQWTPPNHYGCRSCVVEVWESSKLRHPPDFIRAYAKFGPDFFIG